MNSANRGGKQAGDTTYCGFVVGQHVVCVTNNFMKSPEFKRKWERRGVRYPVKGTVYTIRRVLALSKGVSVLLEEIHNPLVPTKELGPIEPCFLASKFRPLKKLKVEDFMSAPVDGERVSA